MMVLMKHGSVITGKMGPRKELLQEDGDQLHQVLCKNVCEVFMSSRMLGYKV